MERGQGFQDLYIYQKIISNLLDKENTDFKLGPKNSTFEPNYKEDNSMYFCQLTYYYNSLLDLI